MKILSVDWDYFFPDTDGFDWGHRESPFFIEYIWWHRCSNRHLFTMRDAIDMKPIRSRLHKFWERQFPKSHDPCTLMISETHAALYYWIQNFRVEELVNYDAHHDLGYPSTRGEIECGNWAGKLLEEKRVKNYTIVYPAWRKQKRYREQIPNNDRVHVTHTPIEAQDYDLLFIARSGAWTPTWCDDSFIKFCEYWQHRAPLMWNEKQVVLEPLKKRSPNIEEAREQFVLEREKWEKMLIK